MQAFIAVMAWTPENRVAKYLDFDTEVKAAAHVERHKTRWPNAFVAPNPGVEFASWLIDSDAKTIAISAPLPPPRIATDFDVLRHAMRGKGLDITDDDMQAARQSLESGPERR